MALSTPSPAGRLHIAAGTVVHTIFYTDVLRENPNILSPAHRSPVQQLHVEAVVPAAVRRSRKDPPSPAGTPQPSPPSLLFWHRHGSHRSPSRVRSPSGVTRGHEVTRSGEVTSRRERSRNWLRGGHRILMAAPSMSPRYVAETSRRGHTRCREVTGHDLTRGSQVEPGVATRHAQTGCTPEAKTATVRCSDGLRLNIAAGAAAS